MNTTSTTLTLIVSFFSDFAISAGTTLTGAMLATGQPTVPSRAVIILAIISGVVVGARRAQALLQPSMVNQASPPVPVPPPAAPPVEVTPKRVDPQPQPVQPKDSS